MTCFEDRPRRFLGDDITLSEDGSEVYFDIDPHAFHSFHNTGSWLSKYHCNILHNKTYLYYSLFDNYSL